MTVPKASLGCTSSTRGHLHRIAPTRSTADWSRPVSPTWIASTTPSSRGSARRCALAFVHVHREPSDEAGQQLADSYFDWIYIDDDHTYDGVLADLELCARIVRPGGFVAGDDYGLSGWWENAVQRAVDQAVLDDPYALTWRLGCQFIVARR